MQQARLDGAALHLVEVDASPVVAHRDAHVIALAGVDHDAARCRLAREPRVGRLEAVVDRVANQVDERVAEPVEDRAVDLELGAAR